MLKIPNRLATAVAEHDRPQVRVAEHVSQVRHDILAK
jgi:hypothetical protein